MCTCCLVNVKARLPVFNLIEGCSNQIESTLALYEYKTCSIQPVSDKNIKDIKNNCLMRSIMSFLCCMPTVLYMAKILWNEHACCISSPQLRGQSSVMHQRTCHVNLKICYSLNWFEGVSFTFKIKIIYRKKVFLPIILTLVWGVRVWWVTSAFRKCMLCMF